MKRRPGSTGGSSTSSSRAAVRRPAPGSSGAGPGSLPALRRRARRAGGAAAAPAVGTDCAVPGTSVESSTMGVPLAGSGPTVKAPRPPGSSRFQDGIEDASSRAVCCACALQADGGAVGAGFGAELQQIDPVREMRLEGAGDSAQGVRLQLLPSDREERGGRASAG